MNEFHVFPNTEISTIQQAAELAHPGDTITVHAGVYRERVNPPRSGASESVRITFQAAPGERVEIKGSEIVKDWQPLTNDVWKASVPNTLFGSFNPFADLLSGDWYRSDRPNHTGAVYLNGHWLLEAVTLEEVLTGASTGPKLWFAEVGETETTIWAQFPGINPNEELVEINVRQSVFYPDKPGINYITVRGFVLSQAATPWAPPTAEQIGVIGTHWSKGWIIENNQVSLSICAGISLGKYGDEWDNKSATADAYNQTIQRAIKNGWSRENIGGHLVRNNTISHCEQVGIVGSLGAIFSTVAHNEISQIHVRRVFDGSEMAGIKLHGAVDVIIAHNHIHHTLRGIWLDWMAQGSHLTGNLLHANDAEDIFLEVNHGPYLLENNILLSPTCVTTWSNGGAYIHNLLAGQVRVAQLEKRRQTPFLKPHSTEFMGWSDNPCGDERWFNNLFTGPCDLSVYNDAPLPVSLAGNLVLNGASTSTKEAAPGLFPDFDPGLYLAQNGDRCTLHFALPKAWETAVKSQLITTEQLGLAHVSQQAFSHPDGSPVSINSDYFGLARPEENPTPGPFEQPSSDKLPVWPKG